MGARSFVCVVRNLNSTGVRTPWTVLVRLSEKRVFSKRTEGLWARRSLGGHVEVEVAASSLLSSLCTSSILVVDQLSG